MEADNIDGKKEPKRLPVWACIPLFIVVLFIFIGLYGTLVSGGLSLVLGVEARHPGVVGYIFVESKYAFGCSYCCRNLASSRTSSVF